jgi:exopolysaccharide biosynthesis polyprenyl glycosylphosphotransferase
MNPVRYTGRRREFVGFFQILNTIPLLLLGGDIVGLVICLSFTFELYLHQPLDVFDPLIYGFTLLVLGGLYLTGAYQPDTQIAGLRSPLRIIISSVATAGVTAALIFLFHAAGQNPLLNRSILLPSLGLLTIWSVILRLITVSCVRSQAQKSSWLMLGNSENALNFAQKLLEMNPLGRLVFLADTGEVPTDFQDMRLSCQGSVNDLPDWCGKSWSGVVVATGQELSTAQWQQLMQIRLQGVPVYKLPDAYESLWYKLPSFLLQDTWIAFSTGFNLVPGSFSMKLKKCTDLVLAPLLLLVLSPLMLLAALAVKLNSPGPVFYSQLRTGLHGKPFRVYKFRSMYQDAEKRGAQWASTEDPRITKVGFWLRIMRIDELPQIWNVLRGEMSLIGPRPERPEFDTKLKQEIPYYEARYLVKPGITGWAQVMYPYGASVEDAYEKLAYDLYYIKNHSLWLDLAIAFKTVRVVLLGKGR